MKDTTKWVELFFSDVIDKSKQLDEEVGVEEVHEIKVDIAFIDQNGLDKDYHWRFKRDLKEGHKL